MAGKSRKRKNDRSRGSRIGMLLLITVIWVTTAWSIAGGTLGKYILEAAKSDDSIAEKFYFASSQLRPDTETTPEFDLTWWDTAQPFTFDIDIRNTVEQLNITGKEIVYQVTTDLGAEPSGTSISGVSAAAALKGSTAAQPWKLTGVTRQEQVMTVTLNPPSSALPAALDAVTVTVTAKSSSPYIQTLKAVYKVHISKDNRIVYYVNDRAGNLAAELYFEVRDAMPSHTSEVKLTWPSGVCMDQSSELAGKLAISGNTGQGALNSGGKYRLLFMKEDTGAVFTASQIKAELQ